MGCVRAQKEHMYGSGEQPWLSDDDMQVYEMRADRPNTSRKAVRMQGCRVKPED